MAARSWIWTLVVVFAVAVVSYGTFLFLRAPRLPPGFVYGSGHIEGTEIKIASETGGRVVDQRLIEGSTVKTGDLLLTIDPQSNRDQYNAALGELAALRTSRSSLDAQISLWTHHLATAQTELKRQQNLAAAGVISPQRLDQVKDSERQAQGELDSLSAQRKSLDGQIASAEARTNLASEQVKKTQVSSPQDGTILFRAVEAGEVIQPGQPLAILVDLQRLELKIYLPTDAVGKIRLNQPAKIRVDAFPGRYFSARVERVDEYAQFTPRDIHLPEERTQMVYGVTLALDNHDGVLKPGMPADGWVRWDDKRAWPETLLVPGD